MTEEPNEEQPVEVTSLEKIATAISVLLVVGILAVLVVDAFHPNTQPSLATVVGQLRETSLAYRAAITVHNSGDDAARTVVVHAELRAGDSTMSETDVTVDWLPGKSSRDVVALFARPQTSSPPTEVRAEVRGFAVP